MATSAGSDSTHTTFICWRSMSFEFPIYTFWIKGEKQSHRSKRCVKYDWLHYDSMADAGFCHLCLTTKRDNSFLAGMKRDPAFISRRILHQSRRRYWIVQCWHHRCKHLDGSNSWFANLAMARCCGQWHDDASNMAGSKHGVAAQLLAEEPCALLTQCYGHTLDLAVVDAIKQALDTAFEISKIRFSLKRNATSTKSKWRIQLRMNQFLQDGLYVVMLLQVSLTTTIHWRGCGMNALRPSWNQMWKVASLVYRLKCCTTILCLVFNSARKTLKIIDNLRCTLQHQAVSSRRASSSWVDCIDIERDAY